MDTSQDATQWKEMNQHQFNRPAHSTKFLLSKQEPDLLNVGVDFKTDSPSIVPPYGVLSGDLVEALCVTFWITVERPKDNSVNGKKKIRVKKQNEANNIKPSALEKSDAF